MCTTKILSIFYSHTKTRIGGAAICFQDVALYIFLLPQRKEEWVGDVGGAMICFPFQPPRLGGIVPAPPTPGLVAIYCCEGQVGPNGSQGRTLIWATIELLASDLPHHLQQW